MRYFNNTKYFEGLNHTATDRLLSGLRLILAALVPVIVAYARITLLDVPLERAARYLPAN